MSLHRTQETWETLARSDPFWAILAEPEFKGKRWTVEDFFETGNREIDEVVASLDRLGLPSKGTSALDFGCGAGRLTQALARHYEHVSGVDISPTMIHLGRQLNQLGPRCEYLLNSTPDLRLFGDASFDLVYSRRTLMHVPRALIPSYILELLRVTRPQGVLVFHLPSGPKNPVLRRLPGGLTDPLFNLARAVGGRIRRTKEARWEMHWISRRAVRRLLERGHGVVRAELEVPSGGGALLGVVYYVTRSPGS